MKTRDELKCSARNLRLDTKYRIGRPHALPILRTIRVFAVHGTRVNPVECQVIFSRGIVDGQVPRIVKLAVRAGLCKPALLCDLCHAFKENNYSTVIDTGVLYTFPQLSQACTTVL